MIPESIPGNLHRVDQLNGEGLRTSRLLHPDRVRRGTAILKPIDGDCDNPNLYEVVYRDETGVFV